MGYIKFILPIKEEIHPEVKKVIIKRNVWGNYAAFVGTKKMFDGARKDDLIDRIKEIYPNAEIIDKTL